MFQPQLHLNNNRGLDRMDRAEESVRAAAGVSRLISGLRRQAGLFVIFCLLGVAFGAIYLVIARPVYTSTATIMIDNRQVLAIHDVSTLSDAVPADTSGVSVDVENQLEVLRSEQIGLAAVKRLNLSEDPDFIDPPKSRIGKIWSFLKAKLGLSRDTTKSLNGPDASVTRQLEALKRLNENLLISRVGKTFLLEIQYSAPDPVLAARIANGYTNAFMLEQLNSRVGATDRTRSWLKQRADEFRELYVKADLDVQKFRADNNLLETHGVLLSEEQFKEMTTQLVLAQADTAQAKARYLHLKNIIDTKQTESAVTESLTNPIINGLRTKYLDAANHLKDLEVSHELAPTHVAIVRLKNTMDELSARLFEELGRVAESYRNDYEVAGAREKSLIDSLTRQKDVAVTANDAQVKLRQLEQQAASYKTLYENYSQRYQGSTQQETFPMGDQHVISAAIPPLTPSSPRKPIVLGISLALGVLGGISIGLLREIMDRVFRTAEQVRDELGVEVLGILPKLSPGSLPPCVPGKMAPIMRYVIDDPFSAFAETLRSAKVAADLALQNRSPKIIGVVSLVPGEGKSTVSKNFASLLALQGAKTLLIDADTRKPALTRAIGCERRQGSQRDRTLPPLADLLKYEPDSDLHILPCIYSKEDPRVADGFSSAVLQTLLQGSDQSFEYVILDLPPIGPVVNARGLASAVDAFIFVVAWGATSRGAVRAVLVREHSISDKLLGVVLNKVDMEKLKIYEHFSSDGYYHSAYKNYYKQAD
jgi:succinoglycan biosynthesis transport protein ExoP